MTGVQTCALPISSYKIIFDANEQAEVFVNGARVCKSTPCQHVVAGGTHNVRMVSKKMPPHEEMIKFFRDEKIIFQFSSVGAGVTITPVSRNGKTIPGVSVYSGRNIIGTAPGTFSLTPSDNRLVLKREGFRELKLKVNPNLNLNLNPVMEVDKYRPFKGLAITGFVVGGVSLFAGVIAYGVASGMNAF